MPKAKKVRMGRPPKDDAKTTTLSCKVPEELREAFKAKCDKMKLDYSPQLRKLVEEWIKGEGGK